MFTVWCEWDIGIEGKVFATREVAIKHANMNLEACGIDENYDQLREERLIGLSNVEIYYE
jgi:hypothetical protein